MALAKSTPTPNRYDQGARGIVIGLIVLGSFIAFVMAITIAVVGTMLATGTLSYTNQGWVFRGSVPTAELSAQRLDTSVDTIFVKNGSGSTETRQLVANVPWNADWAYYCPSSSSSFRLVAQGPTQAYPAGAIDRSASGAGNSNRIPAGSYTLNVTTDADCSWTVGARPSK